MIRAVCYEASGNREHEWPSQFACAPRAGERIQAVSGSITMTILDVTHAVDWSGPLLLIRLGHVQS